VDKTEKTLEHNCEFRCQKQAQSFKTHFQSLPLSSEFPTFLQQIKDFLFSIVIQYLEGYANGPVYCLSLLPYFLLRIGKEEGNEQLSNQACIHRALYCA
jgi:hypothetical protein